MRQLSLDIGSLGTGLLSLDGLVTGALLQGLGTQSLSRLALSLSILRAALGRTLALGTACRLALGAVSLPRPLSHSLGILGTVYCRNFFLRRFPLSQASARGRRSWRRSLGSSR